MRRSIERWGFTSVGDRDKNKRNPMPFWFLNALMLIGLIAVTIPPIIHLLTRKRFDIVDWAAMRFLQVSERTRRKIFLEELLLMLLRMGLIAFFVIALAA